MEISFTLQHTNLMLILCSLVIIFYALSRKFSKKRAITFGNFETLQRVTGKKMFSYSLIPILLRLIALILIVISISDPIMSISEQASNTDYVLAIDTSSSMLTPDIPPNRLEATKSVILNFIKENSVSSFGVVTFSGEARIRSGLTKDKENLSATMENISVDDSAGTAIGEAMIISSTLFIDSKNNKTIILVTDGRNNMGLDVNNTYYSLSEKNINVVCIGLGKTINEISDIPEELKGLNATQAQFPSVDEGELMGLSNATHGSYYHVSEMEDLQNAVRNSIHMEIHKVDLQLYFLLAACAILLIGWALEITKYRVIP
jgi:Ca-activated chloride channel family protein